MSVPCSSRGIPTSTYEGEVPKPLTCSCPTTCSLDPIPTTLLQTSSSHHPGDHSQDQLFLLRWHLSIHIQSSSGGITASETVPHPAVISWMILQSQTRSQTASPTYLHGYPTFSCLNWATGCPSQENIHHNIDINIGPLSPAPSKAVWHLGVMIDDELTFCDQIASVISLLLYFI